MAGHDLPLADLKQKVDDTLLIQSGVSELS
jgi:hypothetical protein